MSSQRLSFIALLLTLLFISGSSYGDSLELRDGRHFQGKYVGGTSSAISFMADGLIQNFTVSDVLLLAFGEGNVEAPLGASPALVPGKRRAEVQHASQPAAALPKRTLPTNAKQRGFSIHANSPKIEKKTRSNWKPNFAEKVKVADQLHRS